MSDPRERDAARRAGWTGPLRGELVEPPFDGGELVEPLFDGGELAPGFVGGAPWPPAVPEAVGGLVAGVRVAARPVRRTLWRAALSGMADTAELEVADGLGSFRVRYPNRPDLFVEELARVVDVAAAMRARFRQSLAHTRLITVDYGQHGFRTSHYSGMATPTLGNIHLNASLFLPEELAQMEAVRERRPSPRPPRRAEGGLSRADLVTAHELWHQVDLAFTARHYRQSIEFRRQVGAYFGVATLEHVITDRGEVRDRLAREVSAYATTNILEAVAELGMLWWWTQGRDDQPPVARWFGEAVERYFPAPASPPRAR